MIAPPSSCRKPYIWEMQKMLSRAPRPTKPSVGEQLIELLVVPVGLVPGGVGSIGDRQHLRRRCATRPIAGNEGTLQPDVVPEAVRRLLLQIDLDAGLPGAGLEQSALVDGAVERRVGGLQDDFRICNAGLLEMERRLFSYLRCGSSLLK